MLRLKSTDKMTRDEYLKLFTSALDGQERVKRALKLALDIRKFEIELYWKRATYFWAFLAVSLVAYFALLSSKDTPQYVKVEGLLVITCIGTVFAVAWYFVNRASKFWQENWEKHVDLLEDEVIGPIYKTVLKDSDMRFWKFWGPYPFSVSKLNQILSLFVVLLFLLLLGTTVIRYYAIFWPPDWFSIPLLALTVFALFLLWNYGQKGSGVTSIEAESRTTSFK